MADLASLYIKVDSKGVVTASKELNKLTADSKKTETATKSVTKSFSKLQAVVIALASSYALLKMAQYVKDATILAARYETLGVVMNRVGNNAGYSSKQMEAFSRGLQKAGIAMIESRNTLARMIQAQIDLTSSQKLARIAQDAAVIGNMNSSQSFEQMIYGLQTGHVRILRTIGLNVDFLKSEIDLAAALDKKRSELSDTEVMQARVNAVVKSGVLIQGVYKSAMETAGKQMLSLRRHLDNLKVLFGAVFTPALAEIIGAITDGLVDLNGELSGEGQAAIEEWGNTFRLVIISIEIEIQKLLMGFNRISVAYSALGMLYGGPGSLIGMIPGLEGAATHFEYFADVMIEATDAFAEHEKAISDLEKKYRDLQEAMTPEGKAKAAAIQKISEDKILAMQKEAKAAEKIQAAIEAANKAKLKLEIDTTDFVKAYNEIEAIKQSAAEMAAKIETVYGKDIADAYINSVVTAYQDGIAAAEKASEDQLAVWEKYNEDYQILLKGEAQFKLDEYAKDLDVYLALEQAKTGATDEEIEKRKQLMLDSLNELAQFAGSQEQAYMDLYNNLGILTQEAYDQIYETYVKDRDDFIALTGDKETAHQVFTERLNALNEEMEAGNKSWIDGAKAGLESYVESSNDSFANIKELAISSLQGMEDAFVDFCMTGKLNFKQLAASILKDLIRIAIQAAITNAIMAGFGAIGGGGGGATPSAGSVAPVSASTPTTGMGQSPRLMAKGGIFANGLSSHSNSIVDSPTFFSFARGQGLMGEAGPEAIMPLTRLPGGDLGVKTESSKANIPAMTVNIHEAPGTQTRVEQSEDGQSLEVIIEQVEQSMQSRMSRGTGMAPFMDGRYGRAY